MLYSDGPFLPSYQTSTLQELILIKLFKEWYKTHSHLKTTDSKEFYFGLTLREKGIPQNIIDDNFMLIWLYANLWKDDIKYDILHLSFILFSCQQLSEQKS